MAADMGTGKLLEKREGRQGQGSKQRENVEAAAQVLTKHPPAVADKVGILASLVSLLWVRYHVRPKGQSQLSVACRTSTGGHIKCMVGRCRQCAAADAKSFLSASVGSRQCVISRHWGRGQRGSGASGVQNGRQMHWLPWQVWCGEK